MPTQISQITSWCAEGQLDPIKLALEEEIPSLSREKQLEYCGHSSPCTSVPCSFQLVIWARCAARKNQLHMVRYLWDTFLGPSGVKVPWESMWCAASRGSISLAEIFWTHDRACFQTTEPKGVFRLGGETQVGCAVSHGHFDYVDYILARGADINAGSENRHPLMSVIRRSANQEIGLERARFLCDRGSWVTNSHIEAAREKNALSLVEFLLSRQTETT